MLVLVTYADIKAVNNEVLTPWKEDLLWQLVCRDLQHLTLGLATIATSSNRTGGRIQACWICSSENSAQDVRDFLDGFPRSI
jgi:UTP:GlnB (protein PII) uridylyltransferase